MKHMNRQFSIGLFLIMVTSGIHAMHQPIHEEFSESVSYSQYSLPGPVLVHCLKVLPHNQLALIAATGKREDVLSAAQRVGALAAINGGFFRRGGRYNGDLLNLRKVGTIVDADPLYPRAYLALSEGKSPEICEYLIPSHEEWPPVCSIQFSSPSRFSSSSLPVHRINQPRQNDEVVLYLPSYGSTTLTPPSGTEIVVYLGHVRRIAQRGNASIPRDGFVVSIGPDVNFYYHVSPGDGASYRYMQPEHNIILGGMGLLLFNGEPSSSEKLHCELQSGKPLQKNPDEVTANFQDLEQRTWLIDKENPRTAIGLMSDGTALLVVVEGRVEHSIGMTLPQLGEFFRDLGAVSALNLGGGGDSTMVFEGAVKNILSGASTPGVGFKEQELRPVADIIAVLKHKHGVS